MAIADEVCDRHPEARAKAKVTLPSGGILFFCGHCGWEATGLLDEFTIEYDKSFV